MKKKKPNRRRTRRKPRQETETAGEGERVAWPEESEQNAPRVSTMYFIVHYTQALISILGRQIGAGSDVGGRR
jgi:hypothetical protein